MDRSLRRFWEKLSRAGGGLRYMFPGENYIPRNGKSSFAFAPLIWFSHTFNRASGWLASAAAGLLISPSSGRKLFLLADSLCASLVRVSATEAFGWSASLGLLLRKIKVCGRVGGGSVSIQHSKLCKRHLGWENPLPSNALINAQTHVQFTSHKVLVSTPLFQSYHISNSPQDPHHSDS